jgi:DNA-binding NarL/FixJ family response regulator
MMKKHTIFIVDDHEIFRDGMKSLINNEELGTVIGEASNGKQFLELLEKNTPDIVLMDIDMPVMNGIEATKIALEKIPDLKILALTMFGDESYYFRIVDAGARGFLLKTSGINELEQAINTVAAGDSFFSNEILLKIISIFSQKEANTENKNDVNHLTPRELEVLRFICKGKTNEKIAEELNISPQTVKGHRSKLLEKTQSNNTASMVIYAIKNKIIEI